jgi:hypothetical protein
MVIDPAIVHSDSMRPLLLRATALLLALAGIVGMASCKGTEGETIPPTGSAARDGERIAETYRRDPTRYWTRMGMPNLARAAGLAERLKAFEIDPFAGMKLGFKETAFQVAVETGQGLSPAAHAHAVALARTPLVSLASSLASDPDLAVGRFPSVNDMTCCVVAARDQGCPVPHLHACNAAGITVNGRGPFPDPDPTGCGFGAVVGALDAWGHLTRTIRLVTADLDGAADVASADAAFASLASIFGTAFDGEAIRSGLFPTFAERAAQADPPDDPIVCGNGEENTRTRPPKSWGEVQTSSVFQLTGPDGRCAALAAGYCGVRLGLIEDKIDSAIWQQVSDGIGAAPEGGGFVSGIFKWYQRRIGARPGGPPDICQRTLHDNVSARESVAVDAKVALELGCDVLASYKHETLTNHVEVVTGVTLLPEAAADGADCVFTTNSWGRSATVRYGRGQLFGKSDGALYAGGAPSTTSSAIVTVFCPCDTAAALDKR